MSESQGSHLKGLVVELSVGCRRCSAITHVGRLDEEVVCHACGEAICAAECFPGVDFDAEVRAVLRGEHERSGRLSPSDGRGVLAEYLVRSGHAVCGLCGADLVGIDTTLSLFVEGFGRTCDKCGASVDFRSAREVKLRLGGYPLGLPDLVWVVGECVSAPNGSQLGTRTLKCTNCGAALQADGSSRVIRCAYCSAIEELPEEVWAELNQWRKKHPLFLFVDVAEGLESSAAHGGPPAPVVIEAERREDSSGQLAAWIVPLVMIALALIGMRCGLN